VIRVRAAVHIQGIGRISANTGLPSEGEHWQSNKVNDGTITSSDPQSSRSAAISAHGYEVVANPRDKLMLQQRAHLRVKGPSPEA
jgi:hypothetical protein